MRLSAVAVRFSALRGRPELAALRAHPRMDCVGPNVRRDCDEPPGLRLMFAYRLLIGRGSSGDDNRGADRPPYRCVGYTIGLAKNGVAELPG